MSIISTVKIAILENSSQSEQVAKLSQQLQLPVANTFQKAYEWYLVLSDNVLELHSAKNLSPFFIDFNQLLKKHLPKKSDPLIKACTIKSIKSPVTWDATAGFGYDAIRLAFFHHQVTCLEQNPLIQALLQNAIERFQAITHPSLFIESYCTEACDFFRQHRSIPPDLIYLDPLFEQTQSKSLPNKKTQLLRQLTFNVVSEEILITQALSIAKHRVVVKKPLQSPWLSKLPPHHQILGKSHRFDVYVIH